MELGISGPLAIEIARQITVHAGDASRLGELGFPGAQARLVAALISGSSIANDRFAETGATPRFVKELKSQLGNAGDTSGVLLSLLAPKSGNAFIFSATRTGDTSGPKSATFVTGPSSLLGRSPTTAALDFGGTYPSLAVTWAAGETTTKTFSVTPTSNATPE